MQLLNLVLRLHDAGIIQTDLKPANVVYNETNQEVLIVDVGSFAFEKGEVGKLQRDQVWRPGGLFRVASPLAGAVASKILFTSIAVCLHDSASLPLARCRSEERAKARRY